MKPLSRSNRIMTESKRRNLNCWISGHSGYLVLHIFMIGIACTADRNCYTRHFQSMGLDSKNPDCHWGCLTPPVGRKRNNLFSSQTRQIEVEASLLECLSAVRWPTALCIINHHPTSRRDLIQRSNKYVNWIHKMYTSLTAQLYWSVGAGHRHEGHRKRGGLVNDSMGMICGISTTGSRLAHLSFW